MSTPVALTTNPSFQARRTEPDRKASKSSRHVAFDIPQVSQANTQDSFDRTYALRFAPGRKKRGYIQRLNIGSVRESDARWWVEFILLLAVALLFLIGYLVLGVLFVKATACKEQSCNDGQMWRCVSKEVVLVGNDKAKNEQCGRAWNQSRGM